MNFNAFSSLSEIIAARKTGAVSAHDVRIFFKQRCELYDPTLCSLIEIFDDQQRDLDRDSFLDLAPLYGIPGVIKDNICIEGRLVTCASRILRDYRASYSATAIERLERAGAVFLGRSNMDEFAMGSSTETSAYFKTKNPWDLSRVPGGSSGGSAAAVAAGLVPWALGTETGGSVRQPAAFCGIVGLKPTYGLISRSGVIAYGSSLDQIGIFTRTVRDNALLLSCMAGYDIKDSSSLSVEQKDYTSVCIEQNIEGLKIGIVESLSNTEGVDSEINSALEKALLVFEKKGARIERIAMPTFDCAAAAAYFIISRAEAASNLARFDGIRYGLRSEKAQSLSDVYKMTRHDGFGAEVQRRILVGNHVLSASHARDYYDNAQKVRHMIQRDFLRAFENVDIILMPTTPMPAFLCGAFDDNKLQMDLQDLFTCPMNLAGNPALSIPCGFTKTGLPVGMQLVGPHLSENLLYKVAHAYEQETEWHKRHPVGYV